MLTLVTVLGALFGYLLPSIFANLGISFHLIPKLPRPKRWHQVLLLVAVFVVSCTVALTALHIPSYLMIYSRPILAFLLGLIIGILVAYFIHRPKVTVFQYALMAVLLCFVLAIQPWTQILRKLGLQELRVPTPLGIASLEFTPRTEKNLPLDVRKDKEKLAPLFSSYGIILAVLERLEDDKTYFNKLYPNAGLYPDIAWQGTDQFEEFFSNTVAVLSRCGAAVQQAYQAAPPRLGHISRPAAYHLYSLISQTKDVDSAYVASFLTSFLISIREAINDFRLYPVDPSQEECPYFYPSSQYGRTTLETSTTEFNEVRRTAVALPYASIVLAYLLDLDEPADSNVASGFIANWINRRNSHPPHGGKQIWLVRALAAWDHIIQKYETEEDFKLGMMRIRSLESLLSTGMKTVAQRSKEKEGESADLFLVFREDDCERNSYDSQMQRYIVQEMDAKNNYLDNVATHLNLTRPGRAAEFLDLPEALAYRRSVFSFADSYKEHVDKLGQELKVRAQQECTTTMAPKSSYFDRAIWFETYARVVLTYGILDYSRSHNVDSFSKSLGRARRYLLDSRDFLGESKLLEAEVISEPEFEELTDDIRNGLFSVSEMYYYLSGSDESTLVRSEGD